VDSGILRVRVPEDDRQVILDEALFGMISEGDRVLARLPDQAILMTGKPVNHLLHFVVSFFCWLWVPIWLVLWLFGGERTMTVTVDEYGEVQTRLQRMGLGRMVLAAVVVVVWLALIIGLVVLLVWLRSR
jgi:hypothetical protein